MKEAQVNKLRLVDVFHAKLLEYKKHMSFQEAQARAAKEANDWLKMKEKQSK